MIHFGFIHFELVAELAPPFGDPPLFDPARCPSCPGRPHVLSTPLLYTIYRLKYLQIKEIDLSRASSFAELRTITRFGREAPFYIEHQPDRFPCGGTGMGIFDRGLAAVGFRGLSADLSGTGRRPLNPHFLYYFSQDTCRITEAPHLIFA